jgi:ABC-type sulfate transport system substrate-binding protein
MILKSKVLVLRLQTILPLAFLAALGLYALWPWLPVPGRAAQPRTVVFYGFSILGEVMNEAVFPTFQRQWQARTGERALIEAFIAFLWSEEAQRRFVEHGFRSVDERLNQANPGFGKIEDPFLIDDYGGWQAANRKS